MENYMFPVFISFSLFLYVTSVTVTLMLTSASIVKRLEVIEGKKMKGNYII